MAIYKRYKGKRIKHGSPDYKRATWIAEGTRDGVRYKQSLPDADTRKDAEIEEDKIITRIREGSFDFHKDKTTFRSYVREVYLPHIQTNNPTWENNKKFAVERLADFFGDSPIKSINRARCEEYKRFRSKAVVACQKCTRYKERCFRCKEKKNLCWQCRARAEEIILHRPTCNPLPVKTSTVNRDLKVLSHLFSLALADGKIKENPMRFVKDLPEPESRMRVLSAEEKLRLTQAIGDNKKLLAIVTIALVTGWRKGQILELKKEDLNFENQTVIVSKSKRSKPRLMPVSDLAWQVIVKLSDKVESGWLFRTERTNEQLKCFKESWWNALKKAGIENLRFHDLRRTCASELLQLGVNEFTIRDVLGHTKIDTTQIYARVQDTDLRSGLQKLGSTYSESELIN